jgi:hypothetical protein
MISSVLISLVAIFDIATQEYYPQCLFLEFKYFQYFFSQHYSLARGLIHLKTGTERAGIRRMKVVEGCKKEG